MFTEDRHETGLFAVFNEDTGRPAGFDDPSHFFDGPHDRPEGFEDFFNDPEDFGDFEDFVDIDEFVEDIFDILEGEEPLPPLEDMPPHEEDLPPEDEGEIPPPEGEPPPEEGDEPPPEQHLPGEDGVENHPEEEDMIPPDGEDLFPPEDEPIHDSEEGVLDEGDAGDGDFDEHDFIGEQGFILVSAGDIVGLAIEREFFLHVFGTEVPNERYRPEDDPYFDDVNGNDRYDVGEPTSPFRPMLFDPHDWRSTDIRLYYRRADNGESVRFEDVDFESDTPRTFDGVELVSRNYKPRLNAFRFGRPNTAINLLTSFSPPEFLNGTHGLTRDTQVDIFMAIAIINLVMDQVFNVEAEIDIDGLGPLPRERMLTDAHMFVAPLHDPFVLLLKGFRARATTNPEP
ncbi:MAG: hypothetical protein IID39_04455 [Planctomycetes bacterium]|nr:hypothetical protein [Planctomycetota bacterium]